MLELASVSSVASVGHAEKSLALVESKVLPLDIKCGISHMSDRFSVSKVSRASHIALNGALFS